MPTTASVAASGLVLEVTRENVLRTRSVILAEADSFRRFVGEQCIWGAALVGLCGGDPISRDARELFQREVEENALAPTLRYVEQLREIADRLSAAARSFGFTEQEIEASFRSGTR